MKVKFSQVYLYSVSRLSTEHILSERRFQNIVATRKLKIIFDMDNPHVVYLTSVFDKNGLSADKKVCVVVNKSLSAANALEELTGFFVDRRLCTVQIVDVYDDKQQGQTYDAVVLGVVGDIVKCDLDLISVCTRRIVAGGALIVKTESGDEERLAKLLKICGFLDVVSSVMPGIVVGRTASYQVGSSDKVTFDSTAKNNIVTAWKLDSDDTETIAEDDLLEADDLKKPDSSALRVCATTKKAKACKDCSCGLAEELEKNRPKEAPKPDTSNAKSSCGSCYLGDAFRCASCPYLGMPAFKPGEKVQLAGNLLQDDF